MERQCLLARKKYLKSRISDQRQEFSRISRILRSGKYRKSDMTKTEKLLHYYGEQGLDISWMQDYRIHNMEKIAAYRQSGHFPEHSLILTFEADLVSRAKLTRIIETRILPYAG